MPKDMTQEAVPSGVCETVSGWTESGEYVTIDASSNYEKPRWHYIIGLDGSIYDRVRTLSDRK